MLVDRGLGMPVLHAESSSDNKTLYGKFRRCHNRVCPRLLRQCWNMIAGPMSSSSIHPNLAVCLHVGRMIGIGVRIAAIVCSGLGLIGSAVMASAEDAKPTDNPSRKFFEQY